MMILLKRIKVLFSYLLCKFANIYVTSNYRVIKFPAKENQRKISKRFNKIYSIEYLQRYPAIYMQFNPYNILFIKPDQIKIKKRQKTN